MSRFRLIVPSGYCINQQAILREPTCLTEAGHQVDNSAIVARHCQHSTRIEAERLTDVSSLANLKAPDTIMMAVRGGYGTNRLLEGISWQGLATRQQQDPLLSCRHSDFMTIQCGLLARGNVISFNSPMLAANFGAEEMNTFTGYHSWQALRNARSTLEWQGDGPQYAIEGILWGGNLTMIISLMGTPWMPAIKNGISTLEDISECPFRVECMLLQLYHAGILAQQNVIILGSFSGSMPNDYDTGYNLDSACDFPHARLSVPLIHSLDSGHEQHTVTLPLGVSTMLKDDKNSTQLTLSGHPVLRSQKKRLMGLSRTLPLSLLWQGSLIRNSVIQG